MKINVGIIGYGNLGKAVEKILLSDPKFNVIAIFSRRNIKSNYSVLVEKYENISEYKNKIDVMILCGGSKSDLEIQTPEALKYFDCINSFDDHKRIKSELIRLDKIAKTNKHILIMSCGWDPGIFSVVRCYMQAIGKSNPITFWGKGVSMGHSDAIRQIDGVIDAVQFTIPDSNAVKSATKGTISNNDIKHLRKCYVVAPLNKQEEIKNKIINMPDYFKNQPTEVHFISQSSLSKLKSKLSHKGKIFENFTTINGTKCAMQFSVKMESNPDFTASILCSYIFAINNMKNKKMSGTFTCADIPVSYLFNKSENEKSLI